MAATCKWTRRKSRGRVSHFVKGRWGTAKVMSYSGAGGKYAHYDKRKGRWVRIGLWHTLAQAKDAAEFIIGCHGGR